MLNCHAIKLFFATESFLLYMPSKNFYKWYLAYTYDGTTFNSRVDT